MKSSRLSKHQLELIGVIAVATVGIILLSAYIFLSGSASTIEGYSALSGFLGGSAVAYLGTRAAKWTTNGLTLSVLVLILIGLMGVSRRAYFYSAVLHSNFLSILFQGTPARFAMFLFVLGVILGGITVVILRVVNARAEG